MCQILCLTSHDPAKLHEIIQKIWVKMSYSQRDGYGAAWSGADGTIGYLKRRYPKIGPEEPLPFVKASKSPESFAESNDIPSDGGFLIIHGRMATGVINVANTHPFVDEFEDGSRVAMIHNGVVRSAKYANVLHGCTCDSELLMRAYVHGGIDEVEQHIDGRYAFMHLEYTPPTDEEVAAAGDGAPPSGHKALHIAKDSGQSLYCGLLADKTYAFATTEGLLKDVDAESEGELISNVLIIFKSKTEFEMTEFTPLTWHEKNWERPKVHAQTPIHTPTHSSYPQLPAARTEPTQLDKDVTAAEQEEITRLEQEAIEV